MGFISIAKSSNLAGKAIDVKLLGTALLASFSHTSFNVRVNYTLTFCCTCAK